MLTCTVFAGSAAAMSPPQASSTNSQDTINGTAIVPGVERLSYISTRYYGVRPAYDACVKETQGRVPDQGDCAETEFSYQDSRLNRAYKALIVGLSGIDKRSVVDAQRAWLAFFAKDCSARAGRFGSDDAPATESICRMESTAMRAQQLEDWHNSVDAQQSH
ncbi:MAG: lysozyme inhibitor LprI family protein [Rhodanobacter sp.]